MLKTTCSTLPALVAILLSMLLAAPALATECEIIDSEFTVLDNSLNSPTSAVLDASGSPVQSDPSSQSYIIDAEYSLADVTTSSPSSTVLDASGAPVQSDPSSQSYLVDTEYSVADVTTSSPSSTILDASGAPVQSDPSSQSYLIDTEYGIADVTTSSPSSTILDASGAPVQSDPSSQSYLIDTEYGIADVTTSSPSSAVLDASTSPVQSDPSSQSYLIDTEYGIADVTTSSPSSAVLDASTSPVQSDPSSQSYLIDTEFTVLDELELEPWSGADYFYCYPTSAFPGEETELTVVVKLTEISMNAGDPVQWYITTPGGETITGESDTLKCCRVGCPYDTAYYDFPEYGTYTIRVEFSGYAQYAEWTVEVWGPTGEIIGEVSNPTNDPVENVDVYLHDAEDKWKVLNFIDEWGSDPTSSVPSYISSAKTGGAGNYQLTEIIPGSYLVLVVPPSDLEYLPKTSDVYVIEKDETEIINLQLEPKVRWLGELDDEMENIRDLSREIVNDDTQAAAEVYVDGYKVFYDPSEDWSKLLSVVLGAINFAMDIANPTATVAKVQLACHGYITNEIAVPIAEHGIDLTIAAHWWNVRGTTFQDKMIYYSNQVNSITWMKEFYPNTVDSPEDALQNGYYTTPIYINGLSLIDDSFEDYNKTIAYTEVPSDFSLSQTENVLRNQVFWLHDKTDGETKIADGITITPTGNVYLFKLTQAHRDSYNNAKLEMEVAKAGQTVSEVASTCGNYISFKGACTLNPHAVGVGMTVRVIGWAGSIAFNSYEIYAKNKVAKQWAYTQIYWAQDLDTIPKINQDVVEWLESETNHPRLPYIDGHIVDTDLHLLQIPFTNKNIAFANEPEYPWWWILPKLRWWILNTNTVTIESTSSIDNVKTRILCIDRYGNEFVSEMPTIHPNEAEPPMLMNRNEIKTIDLPYTGDFRPFNPFHWHYLSTILWMEGKQPDMAIDVYYVIPLSYSPFPYTISSETIMSTQDVNAFMKQPMRSEVCAFTTKESKSDSSITLEDWGNLLGNCTKIIDINIDPVNDSTQVRYVSNASITDVTFLMATIPGSHLNLHVYDELGRHVGYFPVTDSDQIQIPNATYTGNISNPEIILIPDAASKNYTIKIDTTQFTSSSPIPVEVYAIETPVRPAVLGISPVELYPFTSPGETKNITIQLAEVGKQVEIKDVTILQHDFADKFGNPVPDVMATLSQNNFDIGAGNTTSLTITINVPENITLPDVPETRYTGNITIETLNAGTINFTIHLLVLETDLSNAKLTFAEPNVTGIHLSSTDLSDINETHKLAEVTPQSAYTVNSTGEGSFTLQFTDIPDADTITAYGINATDHWIELDTSTTADSVTFTTDVENSIVVFGSLSQPPIASFIYTPENPVFNQTITFDASSSGENITAYKWNFGDGTTTATPDPVITHTYVSPDVYTVTLTVTDNDGRTNTTSRNVTVRGIRGDLNHDGTLTSADVVIALDIAVSGKYVPEADIDKNGYVNALDARMIMQAAADAIEL